MELGVTLPDQMKSTDRYVVGKIDKYIKHTTPVKELTDAPSRAILPQAAPRTSA